MPPATTLLRRTARLAACILIVSTILLVEFPFHSGLNSTTVDYSLLIAILFFAVRWDRLETVVASLLAAIGFLYYFQEPAYTLKVSNPQSYVAFTGFLITALVVSQTALTARKKALEAMERKRETERLYQFGQVLLASESLQTTVWIAIHRTIPILNLPGGRFLRS